MNRDRPLFRDAVELAEYIMPHCDPQDGFLLKKPSVIDFEWSAESASRTSRQAEAGSALHVAIHTPRVVRDYRLRLLKDNLLPSVLAALNIPCPNALADSFFSPAICIPSAFSGQRGFIPACWIWHSSFERQRDFNPPVQRAAQHALYRRVTPRGRPCGPYGLSLHPPPCCLVGPQVSPRSPGSRA